MPALFALEQHRALVVAQAGMHPTTKLMAFHDDVYVVTNPARVSDSFALLERSLWEHAGIRTNMGKTQMFNNVQQGERSASRVPTHPAAEEHEVLLNRVKAVSDLQCAWLILSHCCVARANYCLRTIYPEGVEEFARTHDNAIRAVSTVCWTFPCRPRHFQPRKPSV